MIDKKLIEKLQPVMSGLERLKHLTPVDIGDTWNDQFVEIVESLDGLLATLSKGTEIDILNRAAE